MLFMPPSLSNAQQIALYQAKQIHTAYINNVKCHFGQHFARPCQSPSRLQKPM
ncbi:uncharacterized protein BYT42DRAFT_559567 [Radiomyces spectabilis]|uniref:uncharacterized protein n=1 Tax=Radiomyces spectabilis TaxID=64574 RepID=UPI00221E761A|nr:uncharacterized protein BYT42DRAFT_559567 [Radiomyces spectabilis]KAI8388281.1 hypothetical protein BYT42DRAFT_559567 [Radiomyces spectabilis]